LRLLFPLDFLFLLGARPEKIPSNKGSPANQDEFFMIFIKLLGFVDEGLCLDESMLYMRFGHFEQILEKVYSSVFDVFGRVY